MPIKKPSRKPVSKSPSRKVKAVKAWAWHYDPPYGGIVIPSIRSTRRECKAYQIYNTGHTKGGRAIPVLISPTSPKRSKGASR